MDRRPGVHRRRLLCAWLPRLSNAPRSTGWGDGPPAGRELRRRSRSRRPAVPNGSYLEAHGFGLARCLEHPLEIRDGDAIAPDHPGHDVAFAPGVLDALRVAE
jgi:hypothetical protein